MPTKSKTVKKTQKFVRVTIDEELEKFLATMRVEYPLLSNAELVKLLLSQSISFNQKKKSFAKILARAKFLDIEDEDKQFDYLLKNGMIS